MLCDPVSAMVSAQIHQIQPTKLGEPREGMMRSISKALANPKAKHGESALTAATWRDFDPGKSIRLFSNKLHGYLPVLGRSDLV